jgi:hypothetical protein
MWWLPLLLLVALLVMTGVERFTEPPGSFAVVTRPSLDSKNTLWTSKIAAKAPFGTDPSGYLTALAAFYDEVYNPAPNRPTEAQVDRFVATPRPGTDPETLKSIIMEAFHIDSATKKDESKQVVFEPSAVLLAPKDGVDEVRVRIEDEYTPTDTSGPFDVSPLGTMAPTEQTTPLREAPFTEYSTMFQRDLSPVENI